MKKILMTAALLMMSALAQSATVESQAITDLMATTSNLNNSRFVDTGKFHLSESSSVIDNQPHLKAALTNTKIGTQSVFKVAFKDLAGLSYVVNQVALNDLIKYGDIGKFNGDSLIVTDGAKSQVFSSAVNTDGIVEARRIVIQEGVVMLRGQ